MLKTERMDRVRAALRAQGLTQMIVCDPKSVWYLTGVAVEPYERLLALYLPTEGEPVLFLNRLFNVPEPPCRTVWHTDTDKPVAQIAEVVDAGRPLGIDKEWPAKFLIPLMETHPGMQVVLSSDCVDDCRACKDAEEQALMREASRINDAVNEAAKHYIKAGMTEREVAEFIDAQFRAHGCEGPSFTTIVSFGANAADPHHEPDDTVLKEGDCVLFDMGCVKSRYCSDMTRTWFCGQPTEKQAAVHDLVRRANEAAEALKLTAPDLLALGIIDGIVDDRGLSHEEIAGAVMSSAFDAFDTLGQLDEATLTNLRYEKYRAIGQYRTM